MIEATTTPEAPTSHIGAVVFVEYGRCAGLPSLIGKGRITKEVTHKGKTQFYVEPVESMPLPKWVYMGEIVAYDWTSNGTAAIAAVETATTTAA
jgi:hypothetical protein